MKTPVLKKVAKWMFPLCILLFLVGGLSLAGYYTSGMVARAQLQQLTQQKKLAFVPSTPSSPNEGESQATSQPAVDPETGILLEYLSLYEQNTDLVGWISLPATNIDYPVMQSGKEFYLRRNFEKKYSPYGLPFADVRCDVHTPCQNILIYGHNIKNGDMFEELLRYKEQDFYTTNPTFFFDTLYEKRRYEVVFALFYEDTFLAEDIGIYNCPFAKDAENLEQMLDELANHSLYETAAIPTADDTFLTLSTCSYHAENGRFLLIAKEIS